MAFDYRLKLLIDPIVFTMLFMIPIGRALLAGIQAGATRIAA